MSRKAKQSKCSGFFKRLKKYCPFEIKIKRIQKRGYKQIMEASLRDMRMST